MGSVNVATIATSIAAYSISGVSVKDISEIPESVTDRQCPIMFPDPDNFVTGLSISRESMGADTTAKKNVNYTLNYVFLYTPVGTTRKLIKAIDGLVDCAVAILNAFADDSAPSGAIDVTPTLGAFGALQGPDGSDFFGCKVAINVLTYYEVN